MKICVQLNSSLSLIPIYYARSLHLLKRISQIFTGHFFTKSCDMNDLKMRFGSKQLPDTIQVTLENPEEIYYDGHYISYSHGQLILKQYGIIQKLWFRACGIDLFEHCKAKTYQAISQSDFKIQPDLIPFVHFLNFSASPSNLFEMKQALTNYKGVNLWQFSKFENNYKKNGITESFISSLQSQLNIFEVWSNERSDLNHLKEIYQWLKEHPTTLETKFKPIACKLLDLLQSDETFGLTEEIFSFTTSQEFQLELLQKLFASNPAQTLVNAELVFSNGMRLIDLLIHHGDLKTLGFLANDPILNKKNHRGELLTHIAAKEGQVELLKWLINQGIQIEATDSKGNNIAHCAAAHGKSIILKWLTSSKDHVQLLEIDNLRGEKCIHAAAKLENLTFFEQFRFDSFIKSNDSEGKSIAHYAAMHGNSALLLWIKDFFPKLFYKHYAEAKDDINAQPIFYAIQKGHLELIKQCYSEHAPNSFGVDIYGHSLYHYAILGKQSPCLSHFMNQIENDNLIELFYFAVLESDAESIKVLTAEMLSRKLRSTYRVITNAFKQNLNKQQIQTLAKALFSIKQLQVHLIYSELLMLREKDLVIELIFHFRNSNIFQDQIPIHRFQLITFLELHLSDLDSAILFNLEGTLANIFNTQSLNDCIEWLRNSNLFKDHIQQSLEYIEPLYHLHQWCQRLRSYQFDRLEIPHQMANVPIPEGGIGTYTQIYPLLSSFIESIELNDPKSPFYLSLHSFQSRKITNKRSKPDLINASEILRSRLDNELHYEGIDTNPEKRKAYYHLLKKMIGNIALALQKKSFLERTGPLLDILCTVFRCGGTIQEFNQLYQEQCLLSLDHDPKSSFLKKSIIEVSYQTRLQFIAEHMQNVIQSSDNHVNSRLIEKVAPFCHLAQGSNEHEMYAGETNLYLELFKQNFTNNYCARLASNLYYECIANENLATAIENRSFELLSSAQKDHYLKSCQNGNLSEEEILSIVTSFKNSDLELVKDLTNRTKTIKDDLLQWIESVKSHKVFEQLSNARFSQKIHQLWNNELANKDVLESLMTLSNSIKSLQSFKKPLTSAINDFKSTADIRPKLNKLSNHFGLQRIKVINSLLESPNERIDRLKEASNNDQIKQLFNEEFYDEKSRIKPEYIIQILVDAQQIILKEANHPVY